MEVTTELGTDVQAQQQPITVSDSLAEAGRKALFADFLTMLKHEAGSISGEDIEDVHDMRVAVRRMRSALRLVEPHFKAKAIDPFKRRLRKIARALGEVRDIDVMIEGLQAYSASQDTPVKKSRKKPAAAAEPAPAQDDSSKAGIEEILVLLNSQREAARSDLIKLLSKKSYKHFIAEFREFLSTVGEGVGKDAPYPLSLTLPNLVYERLAAVRAYDSEIEGAASETLHALRVEFKRLRYAISYFKEVLSGEADEFIGELKAIQDHLGSMNDAVVAQAALADLQEDLSAEANAAIQGYIEKLAAEEVTLGESFVDVWKKFNSKVVQSKLAVAVAGL